MVLMQLIENYSTAAAALLLLLLIYRRLFLPLLREPEVHLRVEVGGAICLEPRAARACFRLHLLAGACLRNHFCRFRDESKTYFALMIERLDQHLCRSLRS